MKNENKTLRRSLVETNKNYVEVVNQNLSLRRDLEQSFQEKDFPLNALQSVWDVLDQTEGSEAFVYDIISNSIKSWRAAKAYGRNNG